MPEFVRFKLGLAGIKSAVSLGCESVAMCRLVRVTGVEGKGGSDLRRPGDVTDTSVLFVDISGIGMDKIVDSFTFLQAKTPCNKVNRERG